MEKTKKEHLKMIVEDLVADLLYYDRKECESVSREDIAKFMKTGEVTSKEIVKWFKNELEKSWQV